MARPREFDEGLALDRAMEVFWKHGYQGTSTSDLMEAMGVQRGSFYNAFGSKKEVYLRTLDRYLEVLAESDLYAILYRSERGLGAIVAMLEHYLETLGPGSGPHGCYFVHVIKEHRGEDPEVMKAIQTGIARMRGILAEHVEAAQASGFIPDELDPASVALLMMTVAWGSHVMLEAGMPKAEVLASARLMFEMAGSHV